MSLRKQYPREWNIWQGMLWRCRKNSKGYEDVRVCESWQEFEQFLKDMGPRPTAKHSIDRIDPYGDYEPGNCRWANPSLQRRNVRDPGSRWWEQWTEQEWQYWGRVAEQNGIARETWRIRLRNGVPIETASVIARVPGSGRPPKSC